MRSEQAGGIKRTRRERRGATLILMVLAMTVLIGMAAFALDFGRMYLFRSQLQNAGDSAAWAGLMRLMAKDTVGGAAADTAAAYANKHRVATGFVSMPKANAVPGFWDFSARTFTPAAGGDWSIPSNNAVRANADYDASYIFGRIFGFTTRTVPAHAVAAFGFIGPTTCVRPFAIPYERMLQKLFGSNPPAVPYNPNYDLTQTDIANLAAMTVADTISLKLQDAKDTYTSGNFFSVRMGPVQYWDGTAGSPSTNGASEYSTMVGAPCEDPLLQFLVGPGDWLEGENGKMVGPTVGTSGPGIQGLCTLYSGGYTGSGKDITCFSPVKIKAAFFNVDNKTCPTCGGPTGGPTAFRVKFIGEFTVYGHSDAGGVIGYFNTMSTSGVIVNTPTPLSKPLLVQ